MLEESIYSIIPKNPEESPKKPLYRSKYPYSIPPTGSTLGHQTTTKPGISNLSGEFFDSLQSYKSCSGTQTFGYAKGIRKLTPSNFQKKRSGIMGSNQLPQIRNFSYDCPFKKQRMPSYQQRPALKQRSKKNFIVSNAIQNILSTVKQSKLKKDWLKKKYYGKTPQYLTNIKQALQNQHNLSSTIQHQNQQKKKLLTPRQINEIREGLKQKWNQFNNKYQMYTHIKHFDTKSKLKKKQSYERQLNQIQEDMKKLNKNYIFIEE